jgi:hypothetical protein
MNGRSTKPVTHELASLTIYFPVTTLSGRGCVEQSLEKTAYSVCCVALYVNDDLHTGKEERR